VKLAVKSVKGVANVPSNELKRSKVVLGLLALFELLMSEVCWGVRSNGAEEEGSAGAFRAFV
jgi:hypothetical protein